MAVPSHPDTPERGDAPGAERDLDHPRHTPGDGVPDSETGRETMENGAQRHWQNQDGASESELEERPALSRRALFGATGGFALAAGGLLLPDWLVEDVAADIHPVRRVQQRKEHKRGKHRNQLERRRKQKQHHGATQDQPRGGSGERKKIAFIVHNSRPASVQVQGWDMNQAGNAFLIPREWDWSTIPALPTNGTPLPFTREFFGNSIQVVVRIGTDRLVYGFNYHNSPCLPGEQPDVNIRTGGWDSKGWNPKGKMRADSDGIAIGQSISADGIRITRIDDTPSHVRFSVDLT